MRYVAIFVLLALLSSCVQKTNCFIDYLVFEDFKESPAIAIIEPAENSECDYKVALYLCISGEPIQGQGIMHYRDNSISIRLLNPSSKYFDLFNLTSNPGDTYNVPVEFDSNENGIRNSELIVKVDNKLLVSGEEIFIFRVFDFSCYNDERFDLVYFVTRKSGIIGSYISKFDANQNLEFYISPRGNILPDLIDYSKKVKGALK